MKNYFVGIIFFLLSSFYTHAQIVYIDVNYILNNSEVGKSLNIYIKKTRDENIISYKEIEDKFIKKEKELLAQKNILKKEEFDEKFKILSNEINIYNAEKGKVKNNANILTMPARHLKWDEIKKIVDVFLNTNFEGGRHKRRVEKIKIKHM